MLWLEVNILVNDDRAELLGDILLSCGAISVTTSSPTEILLIEEQIGTHPLWKDVILTAFFNEDTEISEVKAELQFALNTQELNSIQAKLVDDKAWENKWREYVKPQLINDRIWITPAWHEPHNDEKLHLILEPGMAFGTGNHPTTYLCLNWLAENVYPKEQASELKLIDYGCGSGILAIAAKKLGCSSVIAVDIDRDAITTTLENAKKNNVEIKVGHPDEILMANAKDSSNFVADIIVANILFEPLLELSSQFKKFSHGNTIIVLSGILENQLGRVRDFYASFTRDIETRSHNGWSLLTGKI